MGGRGDGGDLGEAGGEGEVGKEDGGSERGIAETRYFRERVDNGGGVWPREGRGVGVGAALNVVGGMGEDELAIGLEGGLMLMGSENAGYGRRTSGKQSLSKTKACNSCPVASGISIQLPNHHGLFLNQPSVSNALYVNSRAFTAA